jgi:hypothetical protein
MNDPSANLLDQTSAEICMNQKRAILDLKDRYSIETIEKEHTHDAKRAGYGKNLNCHDLKALQTPFAKVK